MGILDETVAFGMGAGESENIDQGRLALVVILAGALAERLGRGLAVENVVGNLEGRSERPSISAEVASGSGVGAAEDRARLDREGEDRAGLHGLQPTNGGLVQRSIAVAAFRRKVEHLAADHAAETGRT